MISDKFKNKIKFLFLKTKFNARKYLLLNPDVAASGMDPWQHYVNYGYDEKRKIHVAEYHQNVFWQKVLAWMFNLLNPARKNVRIAVILHLFYMPSWKEISAKLKMLNIYNTHFYITYVDGHYDVETLAQVKRDFPEAELIALPNKGFDIGSFLTVLQKINLDNYDIVYKLQSKGISREFIYIYKQIFKERDWFENLYNGLFGWSTTKKVVKMLTSDSKVGLVAAENLIISDPPHKQYFTYCVAKKLGVNIKEDYHFVAGTCFAIKSQLLKPIQNLGLTIDDFENSERDEFSLAPAMDRIVCAIVEPLGYEEKGIRVSRNIYRRELEECQAVDACRLLYDARFNIDYDFFYKRLELQKVYRYEVDEISLGDIRRVWFDGTTYRLEEVAPFQYLNGNREVYASYCNENASLSVFKNMSIDRYDVLISSMNEGYDERYMPVVDEYNTIMDGQHRSCILMHKYGPEYKVKVLRLYISQPGSLTKV